MEWQLEPLDLAEVVTHAVGARYTVLSTEFL